MKPPVSTPRISFPFGVPRRGRAVAARLALALLLPGAAAALQAESGSITIYSQRHYAFDEALNARFTEETGIAVNLVKAGADELIARLEEEGDNTPADLFVAADGGGLARAAQGGLLRELGEGTVPASVPGYLRDPSGRWVALTMRARVLVYAKDRVNASDLSSYEALASPEWRARLLARSSSNAYNQSMMASLIAANGVEEAGRWAAAVRRNLARPPQGSDRDQIRAVAAGLADVAIANTYYLGLLASSDDPKDREAASKVAIFFPNQEGRGAHINVSGAGVLRSSKNVAEAERYLAFLLSEEIQALYPENTYEYPANGAVPWSPLLEEWGRFRPDELPLSTLGELNAEAVRVFNRAGWE